MRELDEYRKKVEGYMKEYTGHNYADSEVAQIMDRLYDPSGKMIRAMLLIMCAEVCRMTGDGNKEIDRERPFRMAALIELSHYASLIHDDIIDDSPQRRNKPSIQSAYGKTAAVLAGDILLSRIYYNLIIEGIDEISLIMTRLLEEMCIGEVLQDVRKYDSESGMEEYMEAIKGKTANLFRAACKVGCICAEAENEVKETLARFGEKIGYMFQIRDDYLDYMSSGEIEGKATGKDFSEGIYTYPLLAAMSAGGRERFDEYFSANSRGELKAGEFEELKNLIEEYGGFDAAKDYIDKLADECYDLLNVLDEKIVARSLKCRELNILRELVKNVQTF